MDNLQLYDDKSELISDALEVEYDDPEHFGEICNVAPLYWTTQDGRTLPITSMATGHLFNAMKMLFNHLAAEHVGEPVWFQRVWSGSVHNAKVAPRQMAARIVLMCDELEKRQDMPEHYKEPYARIRSQIYPEPARLGE
jgi:hypothetical protein